MCIRDSAHTHAHAHAHAHAFPSSSALIQRLILNHSTHSTGSLHGLYAGVPRPQCCGNTAQQSRTKSK
eukprot:814068-Alexandrium_andersonii.AAC.1